MNCFSAALLFVPFLILMGCGGTEKDQAFGSDANGYVCRKCEARFYTDRAVFAEACPNCEAGEITEVMAFVCPADKAVTLAPRGIDIAPCAKCGKPVRELKLPQAAELKAWGAGHQPEEKVAAASP